MKKKHIAVLSVLLLACLLAAPALAGQNRNCGENCNNINCPYANQDRLGNQNQYGQTAEKDPAAQSGLAAQKELKAQDGSRGEGCNRSCCPYGNQDGLGNQYGRQDKGRANCIYGGDCDRKRDGSCQR